MGLPELPQAMQRLTQRARHGAIFRALESAKRAKYQELSTKVSSVSVSRRAEARN